MATLRIAMLSVHSSPLGPLGSQNTGGMSVYVSELARWLGRYGHRIDIFTYMPGSANAVRLHPNVRLIHLLNQDRPEVPKERMPFHLEAVFSALESYRRRAGVVYDLIHSHYWLSGEVGALARDAWRVPHLMTFHTLGAVKNQTTPAENEPRGRISRERRLVRSADRVIVPVAAEKDHLVEFYGAPPDKVTVIAGGVNLERFQPRPRIEARRALGMNGEEEIVLFVGRFAPLKGLDALLEAVAVLAARRPHLRLILVGGDGPRATADRALRAKAASLGITGRVRFAGRVPPEELIPYYAAADLLALPSHYESFGLVVLEALACGTPVLATPVGIAPAVIAEGVNGTLVPAPRTDALVQGMGRWLLPRGGRRPSQTGVRATVVGYGWDSTAAATAREYLRAREAFAF